MQDFWSPLQQIIENHCSAFDCIWQKRQRTINTRFLVIFILKLVLSKNSQGYKSLLNELWESNLFSSIQECPVAASSVSEARQKMPETIFTQLNQALLTQHERDDSLLSWRGHQVFAVDGSKINLPHELLQAGYNAPNRHQYYPQGLLSIVYDLRSGLVYDGLLTAYLSERHALLSHITRLSRGDILVLDRGYFSYLILHQAIERGIHLICRMQSGTVNSAVQAFWDSKRWDEVVTYSPSISVKYESKKQGYDITLRPIKLRLIKYKINDEIYLTLISYFS